MSSGDLWFRDLARRFGLLGGALALLAALLCWRWSRFHRKHFRSHLRGFERECLALALPLRRNLFRELGDLSSHDPGLRRARTIRILEIGLKTGDNLQFYPRGAHLVAVDWNRRLPKYLLSPENAERFGHVVLERMLIGDGSRLRSLPNGHVDAVVTTRALCSARSIDETLAEVRRVLAPNGRYYFVEHVPGERGSILRIAQTILTLSRVWPALFGGCRLSANPIENIRKAGFAQLDWEYVELQGEVSQPHYFWLSRRHVVGWARKND